MKHDIAPLVPHGAAFYKADGNLAKPRRFVFLVCPSFTLLAFASALDPLRIANQLSQQPLYDWTVRSLDGTAPPSSTGVAVHVDGPLGEVPRDDTLVVCGGNRPEFLAAPRFVSAVNRHARHGGTVVGLCTGAFALAKAGLLESRSFTLHWENQPGFCEAFPNLAPSANKFEIDGPVITCGGGAASTDLMLDLIERDHGKRFAAMVSDMCLRRVGIGSDLPQRSSISAIVQKRNPLLSAVVDLMSRHLEDPLSMSALSIKTGYSRRHLERLFTEAIGQTPARYYLSLRLDHARSLLTSTNLSLSEVTSACGFACKSHFAKAFTRRFGVPPGRTVKAARSKA